MDGGKNWVLLDLGFDELDGIDSVVINRNDPAQIFVGTFEGLYTSHDRGCHFESITIPRMLCIAWHQAYRMHRRSNSGSEPLFR
jgi:hypothetical protein